MKRAALSLLILVACGASGEDYVTAPAMSEEPTPRARRPGPAPDAPSATESAGPGKAEAPAKRRRPVLLSVTSVEAPLFSDEVERLRSAVAARLEASTVLPIQVIPQERLVALRALASSGRLREGGPKCAAAPSGAEAIVAAYPGLAIARLSFLCAGEQCNGHYAVYEEDYREHTALQGKKLIEAFPTPKDPVSEADWSAAISAKESGPSKVRDAGGGGSGFGRGIAARQDRSVRVEWVDAFHFAVSLGSKDFKSEAAAATKACTGGASDADLVMAVDPSGKVTRCEEAGSKGDCYCAELSKHLFDRGEGNRRVRLTISRGEIFGTGEVVAPKARTGEVAPKARTGEVAPPTKTASVTVHQRGRTYDEPMSSSKPREQSLATCFDAKRPEVTFDVESSLDETGRVTDASVTSGADKLSAEERGCVERAAKTFLYRCPDKVGDKVWARYAVRP